MAIEREATVVWEGDLMSGTGHLTGASGALDDSGMTFARRGGDPEGHTTPEELIAGAHAGCYAMSLANRLAQDGNPPDRLEVGAVCVLDRADGGLAITTIRLNAKGTIPGIDAAGFEAAARAAEQTCPVSNALRGGVEIELTTELEG